MVLGQRFRDGAAVFDAARGRYRDRIAHWGFVEDRKVYSAWLASCDVVVSTAIHEFFGLSVLEAVAHGCFPLLPDRLSYPELLPATSAADHLYTSEADLVARLEAFCRDPAGVRAAPGSSWIGGFLWPRRVEEFDRLLAAYAGEEPA